MGSKDGKRIRRAVIGKTKQEVMDKLSLMQVQKSNGTLSEPTKLTVGEYLLNWVKTITDVTDSTRASYKEKIEKHIIPAVGQIKLQKVTGLQLNTMISELKWKGRAGKKRVIDSSDRTKQYVYSILSKAFKQARKWRLIAVNPVEEISRPRSGKFEITPYDEEQCLDYLEACKTEPDFCNLLMLTPLCGGRQGEMRALRWPDYRAKVKTMSVRRTISINKEGKEYEKETKTRSGVRPVPLPEIAIECLEAQRPIALSRGSGRDGLIFPAANGGYLDRFEINRAFHRVLKKAKLPRIRFHDLRHTHATLCFLIESNPKVVQERLGHATIAVTMDIYGHVMPSMQTGVVEKLDAMFEAQKLARKNGNQNGNQPATGTQGEAAVG